LSYAFAPASVVAPLGTVVRLFPSQESHSCPGSVLSRCFSLEWCPWPLRYMLRPAGASQQLLAQDVLLQEQPHKQAADPVGVNRQLHLCTRHPRRTIYAARIHRDGLGDRGSSDGGVCLEWR
jgi:hypothetical protein